MMVRHPQSWLSRNAAGLLALACSISGATLLAQTAGSPVTYDAQVALNFSNSISTPYGVAVAPDGTVYVSNVTSGSAGKVIRITPSDFATGTAGNLAQIAATSVNLSPSGTLSRPTALAVDSNGVLYIADTTGHRILRMANPESSNTSTNITYSGTMNPVALAVDSSNNLYVADQAQHKIFKVLAGGSTGTALTLSGGTYNPVGLAVDAAGNVFFADNSNAIYKYSTGGATSLFLGSPSGTYAFKFSSATVLPIGMGFDPLGNLFVMDSGAAHTGSNIAHLFEIGPTANWYLVPTSQLSTSFFAGNLVPTSIAVDSNGNIFMGDDSINTVDELFYNNNPVNFGNVNAGTTTANVTENFQFNTAIGGPAFFQSVGGEYTGEFSNSGSICSGSSGSTCTITFRATYQSETPGLRNGVFGLTDTNKDVIGVRVNAIDVAASLDLFPGTQNSYSKTFIEPQSLAVTGNGGTVFVADEGGVLTGGHYVYNSGAVWACSSATSCTAVSNGSFPTPMAVAVDAAGYLYVADYSGKIYVVAPSLNTSTHVISWPGFAKQLTLPGGPTLYHPMSLTVDPYGNLYIGDMGPEGTVATADNPGFIVEVPKGQISCGSSTCTMNGQTAFKLSASVGGVPIVFPQAISTDRIGNLYVADGGDGDTDQGGVDVIPVSGAAPVALSFGTFGQLNQPASVAFDAADDLYVLDGYNLRILVAQMNLSQATPTVTSTVLLGNDINGNGSSGLTAALTTPSNLVVSPGGHTITISDIGYQPSSGIVTPAQVVSLNATNSSVDASSGSASVLGVNVGNQQITFNSPTRTGSSRFTLSGCGAASGNTLTVGVSNTCTSTVNLSGTATSQLNATFTLNGRASADYSTLGNQIFVTGNSVTPIATLTAPYISFNQNNTATLQNTGGGTLSISSVGVTGDASYLGGTCTAGTNLTANQSCTILYRINDAFSIGGVTVTDNVGTQTASTLFLFSIGFTSAGNAGGFTLAAPASQQLKVGVPSQSLSGTGGSHTATTLRGGKVAPKSTVKSNTKLGGGLHF